MSTPEIPSDGDSLARNVLRLVALGTLDQLLTTLAAHPDLVNVVGPHPFWGGRPQPLHVAIETGRSDIFQALLDAGADVDGRRAEYDGWSPLMLAVTAAHPAMRDALLAAGACVGLPEALLMADDGRTRELLSDGVSALPASVPNSGSLLAFARTVDAIDRLLVLGVSAEARDRWGSSPLDALSRLGARGASLVAHLAARGVDVPPEAYARLGDQSALAQLWSRDPGRVTNAGVLMAAVDLRQHALVSRLLAQGARVDARAPAPSRHTALHAAAWNGDAAMVSLLVEAGADATVRDDEHHGTPADWARAAVDITRHAACATVAGYLDSLTRDMPAGERPAGT